MGKVHASLMSSTKFTSLENDNKKKRKTLTIQYIFKTKHIKYNGTTDNKILVIGNFNSMTVMFLKNYV